MNILFIGGAGSAPDANSACVRNMAKDFMAKGHRVVILAMGDKYTHNAGDLDGAVLWHVPMDYYRRLTKRVEHSGSVLLKFWFKVVSIVRHFILLFFYPNTSPGRATQMEEISLRLVREYDIKLAICIFTPYDNIYAGLKLKEKLGKEIKIVSYHLDLRTSSISSSAKVRNYIYKHALKSLVKESRIVDKILIPFSGKKETELISEIDKNKIRYVGLPVFVESQNALVYQAPFDKDAINICYIGSLAYDNRDPRFILSLMERVNEVIGKKIIIHFWGNMGGFEPLLMKSPVALYHGVIDNGYTGSIMSQADILLNIGNAIAFNMLPSKVFGMFATGKPIINVISHPEDSTIQYFKLYGNSIDIIQYGNPSLDVKEVGNKLMIMKDAPLKRIDHDFDDFKPETICNLIINE